MPYLGKQSEQVGVSIQKYEFLQATDTSSGTTSFSVPSDAGDHVNVWLNGVLLVEGGSNDYTTTNTTVVFGTAPADGDIVRIDVVESFALPDALKSSGDTMTGALKLDGGIKQQTSQDLSGTYAYHQLMLSDAFTVAGDVTISDNLVLAKLSDDSNAITISNDTSTRTIEGTGSLEASTLAQTPNASLTGMTGELGSAVTFPTGHVLGIAIICDQKAYNEHGGAFNSGAWRTRDLNTVISDVNNIVSISSNQFTLQAGNYLIEWTAPAYNVTYHLSKLRGITSNSNRGYGTSERTGVSGGDTAQESIGTAYVSLSGAEAFEIQHKCTTDRSLGFGAGQDSLDSATVSIYTIVKIIKIA